MKSWNISKCCFGMKWCRTQKTLRSAWKKLENLECFKRVLPACTTCFEFLRGQAKSQSSLSRSTLQVCEIRRFVFCFVFLNFFLFNEIVWGFMFIVCLEALEIWGCVQACSLTFHTQTANAKCFGDRLLEQDTATQHEAKSEWLGGSWAFKHSSFNPFDFRWSYYIFKYILSTFNEFSRFQSSIAGASPSWLCFSFQRCDLSSRAFKRSSLCFLFSSLMGKSAGGSTRSCKKQSNMASTSFDGSLAATLHAASKRAWLGLTNLRKPMSFLCQREFLNIVEACWSCPRYAVITAGHKEPMPRHSS